MKRPQIIKLATAATIEQIERLINEFVCGGHYCVDPETLAISNPLRSPPSSWFVRRYRGGYLFGAEVCQ